MGSKSEKVEMKIRTKTGASKWITKEDWHRNLAHLPDVERPVVLRIDERKNLVKVRPKTYGEVLAVQKKMVSDGIRQGSFSDMVPPTF